MHTQCTHSTLWTCSASLKLILQKLDMRTSTLQTLKSSADQTLFYSAITAVVRSDIKFYRSDQTHPFSQKAKCWKREQHPAVPHYSCSQVCWAFCKGISDRTRYFAFFFFITGFSPFQIWISVRSGLLSVEWRLRGSPPLSFSNWWDARRRPWQRICCSACVFVSQ